MNVPRASAAASLLATLSSCVTPFAPTEFPVLDDPGVAGIWELEFQPAPEDESDGDEFLSLRFLVSHVDERTSESREGGSLSSMLRMLKPDQPTSLRVSTLEDDGDGESAQRFLHGQLIQAGESTFLTLQPDATAFSDPFHLFAAPIQRTFRFERDGDVVRLWWHRRPLIWTPLPFAGELQFERDDTTGERSSGLVQDFDDALHFYGDSRDEDWTLFATATRIE